MYIVTCGAYADYHISGAFNTLEEAELYSTLLATRSWHADNVRIEHLRPKPYHIDALLQAEQDCYAYRVWIQRRKAYGVECLPVAEVTDLRWTSLNDGDGYIDVYAKNEEGALQEANDAVFADTVNKGNI